LAYVQLNFGVVGVSVSERVPEEYLTYCCSIQQYPGKTCYTLDYQVHVENIGEDASKKGLFTSFTLCKQRSNWQNVCKQQNAKFRLTVVTTRTNKFLD
jgi:hypothetical protein